MDKQMMALLGHVQPRMRLGGEDDLPHFQLNFSPSRCRNECVGEFAV